MVADNKPRVVLVHGNVRSKNDGNIHFVGIAQLARLYELRQDEYEAYNRLKRYPEGTIFLYPRYDGNYRRPEALG